MTTGLGSVPAFVFGVPKRAQRIQALLAVMMALVPVLYAWPMLTGGVRGPGFTVLRFLMAWVVARRARFVARNLSGLHLEWVIAFTPVALVATAEGRTSVMWDDVTGATIPSSRSNFAFVHVVAQRDRVRRDTRFPQLRQLRRRRASEIWFPGHSLEGAPEFVRWAIEHYARDPEHRAEIGTEWERARLLAAYSRVATGR